MCLHVPKSHVSWGITLPLHEVHARSNTLSCMICCHAAVPLVSGIALRMLCIRYRLSSSEHSVFYHISHPLICCSRGDSITHAVIGSTDNTVRVLQTILRQLNCCCSCAETVLLTFAVSLDCCMCWCKRVCMSSAWQSIRSCYSKESPCTPTTTGT